MRHRALLAVVGACGVIAGCGSGVATDASGPDVTWQDVTWQRINAAPFAARSGAATVWTGTEALFLGGDIGAPCPPNANCVGGPELAKDGGAFDPVTGTWRATKPAPEPIRDHSGTAMLDGTVYLWGTSQLLAYDPAADTWQAIDAPDGVGAWWSLAPLGDGRLVAVASSNEHGGGPDRVYDPAAKAWTTLPPDPLGPMFDRTVTGGGSGSGTGTGIVLTGHELVDQPGSDKPSVVIAAVFDPTSMTWRRLPDSDQLGGVAWSWTGNRLIMPALGGADGGETGNYGRTIPNGGILDPATGTWSRLPHPPKLRYQGIWPVYAPGGSLYAADGWIYDDEHLAWTKIHRPDGSPQEPGDAVWAGRQLIVVGGLTWEQDTVEPRSNGAWMLTLAH